MKNKDKILILKELGFKKKFLTDKSGWWYEKKFKHKGFEFLAYWEIDPEYAVIDIKCIDLFSVKKKMYYNSVWSGSFKQLINKLKQLNKSGK